MTSDQPDQFWLLTGEIPTGPFTAAQIHAELASGRATWQTSVCLVGGHSWQPLIQTPGFGPVTNENDRQQKIHVETTESSVRRRELIIGCTLYTDSINYKESDHAKNSYCAANRRSAGASWKDDTADHSRCDNAIACKFFYAVTVAIPMRRSLPHSMFAYRRWSTFANASPNKDSKPPWANSHARADRRNSTAKSRPPLSRWPARRRPRALPSGLLISSPDGSSSCRSSSRFPGERSVGF